MKMTEEERLAREAMRLIGEISFADIHHPAVRKAIRVCGIGIRLQPKISQPIRDEFAAMCFWAGFQDLARIVERLPVEPLVLEDQAIEDAPPARPTFRRWLSSWR